MNVQRQENILRYLVQSRSKVGVTHVVELDLYDGNGGCSCQHFTFRLEPLLKAGNRPEESDALRCDHIRAARRKLVDDIIRQATINAAIATAPPEPRQRVERVPPPRYKSRPGKPRPRGG
jgi:hypothetical protein